MAEGGIGEIPNVPSRHLPDGKQYHVFFSYRDVDGEHDWVRMVINELQKKYGFICCDHELDFQPGKKIVENIKHCIQQSVKTVVVLSKEYTESFWCQMELEITLQIGINRKEQILIPVCKEDFKDVPDYLPLMTCIDARGPLDTWINILVSAIESPVDNITDSCFTQHFLQNSNFRNLDIIYEETSKVSCTDQPFETRFIPDYLRRSKINLNPEVFTDIFNVISANRLVTRRMCINPWWPICLCWVLTVPDFLCGAIGFIIFYFTIIPLTFYLIGSFICLAVFAVFGVMWPCFCFRCNKKGHFEMRQYLLLVNNILMQHNIFVAYKTEKMSAKTTVYFLYYDAQPCIKFIQSHMNTETSLKDVARSSVEEEPLLETDDTVIETENSASDIILNLSADYFEDFLRGKIGCNSQNRENRPNRHSPRALCFCEYAEKKKAIRVVENSRQDVIEV